VPVAPRVQITRPNTAITTSSKDPILHTTNAATDGGKASFNVAIPVPGLRITKSLMGPGLLCVVCNTHPWMGSYIVVTDDLTAMTAADGTFTLSDVPAGTYELRVWHETLKAPAQKVVVRAAQATSLDIKMQ
jgi:Carboxypeptidase regulatory-like domain